MKFKIKITDDMEDAIVAKSLQLAYDRNHGADTGLNQKDVRELQKALRVVFHYYTGEKLK